MLLQLDDLHLPYLDILTILFLHIFHLFLPKFKGAFSFISSCYWLSITIKDGENAPWNKSYLVAGNNVKILSLVHTLSTLIVTLTVSYILWFLLDSLITAPSEDYTSSHPCSFDCKIYLLGQNVSFIKCWTFLKISTIFSDILSLVRANFFTTISMVSELLYIPLLHDIIILLTYWE